MPDRHSFPLGNAICDEAALIIRHPTELHHMTRLDDGAMRLRNGADGLAGWNACASVTRRRRRAHPAQSKPTSRSLAQASPARFLAERLDASTACRVAAHRSPRAGERDPRRPARRCCYGSWTPACSRLEQALWRRSGGADCASLYRATCAAQIGALVSRSRYRLRFRFQAVALSCG